jgi:hypothetical protein
MIWVPAAPTDQHIDVLGLDDKATKILQLIAEIAAIALSDRIFAGGEPIAHLRL